MSEQQSSKTPAGIVVGDVVIPTRGRYQGLPCEVKDVRLGKYAHYNLTVVPVLPTADIWSVDYNERVRVVSEQAPRPT